jgi:hypothetical protein
MKNIRKKPSPPRRELTHHAEDPQMRILYKVKVSYLGTFNHRPFYGWLYAIKEHLGTYSLELVGAHAKIGAYGKDHCFTHKAVRRDFLCREHANIRREGTPSFASLVAVAKKFLPCSCLTAY